jgi:hypothetical protein
MPTKVNLAAAGAEGHADPDLLGSLAHRGARDNVFVQFYPQLRNR